ncbi:zinc ribbon domain-containing protein [Prolixibacteraceae bacterium Z1-6]|uniref:Zinc ribbon domain-containing protein n=1 Tax=Draconibacterium aestuarii TaxID=2998507 RepID=A0A9X3FA31_9BACT|nr:zinc ribbon domain-containing protein [Prolixibacteraceae bacterium Z1-6]
MIRCTNCGVELEENANFCSLCGAPLLKMATDNLDIINSGKTLQDEKLSMDFQKLTGFQKRKIFWKISGIILISAIIITLLIDFIASQTITWSKYPATISSVLFINFTLNTYLHKKIILLLAISFLFTTVMFFLFDIYAGETGWELKLGVPVILALYITIYSLVFLIRDAKQKGLNIIAYSIIAAGLLCIYTEAIISIFLQSSLSFGWSLIVLVSVAFISALLFYIHYRLKKATDLKRFFHI